MRGRNRESPRAAVFRKCHPEDRSDENRQGLVRYLGLARRPKRETAFFILVNQAGVALFMFSPRRFTVVAIFYLLYFK